MTFPILGGNGAVAGYQIDNSLRFNDDDSAKLQRTPSSDGNKRVWTISTWLKRSKLGALQTFFGAGSSSPDTLIKLTPNDEFEISRYSGGYTWQVTSSNKLRDSSAWYHLVGAVDTTQGTASNRVKLYINGVQVSSFTNSSYPSQNFDTELNDTSRPTKLGTHPGDTQYYDGYMTETHFVDGSQLAPTDFGEFDEDSGIWKPKEYTGTYGTNGFYLDFENSSSLGADQSGNGNDFTPTNLASTDQTTDTPTNNFCTMNPLEYTGATYGTGTLSEGNCKVTIGDNNTNVASFTVNQGKWYWEQKHISSASSQNRIEFGIIQQDVPDYIGGDSTPNQSGKGLVWAGFGDLRGYISTSSFGTFAPNDIIGCALDMDAQTLQFYKNGSAVSTAQDFSGAGWTNVAPTVFCSNNAGNEVGEINFGNPIYSISSGNSDGNGYGNFEYAPPSGYLALCTQNLATELSPTIDDGSQYFNTVLYTGDGNNSRTVTGTGFQPDWAWIKVRNTGYAHKIFDSNRGAGKRLMSQSSNAEATVTDELTSFDSDGFTTNNNAGMNENTRPYVAWQWLAGGTAPSQTYTVKVVSDSGNKYRFDDFGTSAVTLDLQEGGTYTFDQSDSSNSGHPLRFSTTSDGTHGSGSEYTTGVTTTGTPGSAGAKTVITVASSAPTLYYYCSSHSGMGGQANTNSTHGSSNFAGSIQSVAQANTTAGFSIVTYTGTGANATVGHGLGKSLDMILVKNRSASSRGWVVWHNALAGNEALELSSTDAKITSATSWNSTVPTSSVFSVGTRVGTNESSQTFVAYCFADIEGYSKFGSYTSNGSTDGPFIYTGFRPAWLLVKKTGGAENWQLRDTTREPFNVTDLRIEANNSNAEGGQTNGDRLDILSNGFKCRDGAGQFNETGNLQYIYMAFAENPFVTSSGVPVTAR